MSKLLDFDVSRLTCFKLQHGVPVFATRFEALEPQNGAAPLKHEIVFDPPYYLETGKTYALRQVGGQQQMWEIEPRTPPMQFDLDNPEPIEWIRQAERRDAPRP